MDGVTQRPVDAGEIVVHIVGAPRRGVEKGRTAARRSGSRPAQAWTPSPCLPTLEPELDKDAASAILAELIDNVFENSQTCLDGHAALRNGSKRKHQRGHFPPR